MTSSTADTPTMARPLALTLLWPAANQQAAATARMTEADWAAIDRVARQHRLRPLFYRRSRQPAVDWDVPPEIVQVWREIYNRAAIQAMMQRAELIRIGRRFADCGITAFALKGASLTWQGWFDPALRPMRDLDLLVSPAQATIAHQLLREHGFIGPPAGAATLDKHLPGLTSPIGAVHVEIHTRLIDVFSAEGICRDDEFRASAAARSSISLSGTSGLRLLSPADNLLHIIVHSVLDHQFNNGPVLLWDLLALINHARIDWNIFWAQAERLRCIRACQLALRLAELQQDGLRIDWGDWQPVALTDDILSRAQALMLVDLDRGSELGVLGRMARLNARERMGRLGKLWRGTQPADQAEYSGLMSRAARYVSVMVRKQDRSHVLHSLRVAQWLRTP